MFRKFSILYAVACIPSLALIAWGSELASEKVRPVVPSADLQAWAAEVFGAGDVLPKLTGETPVPPFSFMYEGQASPSFLRTWQEAGTRREEASQFAYVVSWTDPKTGLKVTATVTAFTPEMLRRSVVQTRSDTACRAGRSEWDQCQTYGLNLYLPLHATIGWDVGAYECRSSATSGFCAEWAILDKAFPLDAARASITEIQANRKYWLGDFYPLTPATLAADVWMAWQLHRSDLDEGLVLAFRRKDCPQATRAVKLRGLTAEKLYTVTWIDDQRRETTQSMPGRELAETPLSLPQPRSSMLLRYAPKR